MAHTAHAGAHRTTRQTAMPEAGRAVDMVMADDTLRAAYLLQFAGNPGAPALDEPVAIRFLLWFAVEGRHRYQHVCLSPQHIAFLATPEPPFATRLAAFVHDRHTGDARFHDDIEAFHAWYYQFGVHQLRLTPLLVARERDFLANQGSARAEQGAWYSPPPQKDRSHLPGINIIGAAEGVSGIGEDVRALTEALLSAGVQLSIFNVRYPAEIVTTAQFGREAYFSDRPIYPINVFCLPAFETARLKLAQGDNLFAGRYNIGYWPWELTSLPPSWHFAFGLVDEVWASSRFLLDVFQRLTSKPVLYMPPHVGVPAVKPFDRQSVGLSPADVVFLCMFDFNSYIARKNPAAAIEAFQAAFTASDGRERLLIKTINGHANAQALRDIQRRVAEDDRIVLVDGSLARDDVCGLLQDADCYVSLHRSEGFGRILAEAMLLGTPVIATDWSGSASFLTRDTGFPVSCSLRQVRPDEYVYADGSTWAEPSISDAARQMRFVRQNRRAVEAIRVNAARAIRQKYGLGAASSRLSAWLTDFATKGVPR